MKKETEEKRQKMEEEEQETAEMVAKIKNINLEKMELDDVVKFISDCFASLIRVKNKWSQVTEFFNRMAAVIEELLKENAKEFASMIESKNVSLFLKNSRENLIIEIQN